VTTEPLDRQALTDTKGQISPFISVIIPIYNEHESLPLLIQKVADVFEHYPCHYEIICVDDGSQDGSTELLRQIAHRREDVVAVIFRRNYGQTPAMAAGFQYAQGDIIVSLDGDLQNEPKDIPVLISKLEEGYDLVSGWRKNRQDATLTRLVPSKIANFIIGRVTGVKLHDYGCSLKAYRREVLSDMNLYGELHRFLPALAYIEGAKITEIPVGHHARQYGQSKYGLGRTFRVLMDLLTIFFLKKFLTRPMHIFGFAGLVLLLVGLLMGGYLTFIKLVLGASIGNRPLLILAALLILTSVQLLSVGLLAELIMRTYHESQKRPIYRVREIVGRSSKNNSENSQ
jgi:glycosyltransferase involved in cell wall biosynthesis